MNPVFSFLNGLIAAKPSRQNPSADTSIAGGAPGKANDPSFRFASPASTSLDELLSLRELAASTSKTRKRRSAAPIAGAVASKRLGRGLDFAEVREYQAGDDVRMIDWKVTARTGHTHTKLFVEERERPVTLVVDFRSHMRFGTQGMFKSVLAARLAAILGWTAVANHDRLGGFVFTDDWHTEIRPRAGRRGLMALFRGIAAAQMHTPTAKTGQLADTLTRLRHSVHPGSTVILLSDFIGFDENARTALGGVIKKLDMVAVHVADPIEFALPQAGRYAMTGMHSTSQNGMLIETSNQLMTDQYLQKFQARSMALTNYFNSNRHVYLQVSTDQPLTESAGRIITRQASTLFEQTRAYNE